MSAGRFYSQKPEQPKEGEEGRAGAIMRTAVREQIKQRLYGEFLPEFDRGDIETKGDWLERFFLAGQERGLRIC